MNTFTALGLNRLNEPGPMVNVRVFDSLQEAKDYLQFFASGVIVNQTGEVLVEKGGQYE
ncbi:hypothetical protein [Faecalibaculum rodentium]|uniref:hypothetical protein n=1 Tax=Faecalibaculum rodentium TaxID=1702221 RepID=UPI00272F7FC4|nr:hypothetical protein [Faecalibaculum rodentium]